MTIDRKFLIFSIVIGSMSVGLAALEETTEIKEQSEALFPGQPLVILIEDSYVNLRVLERTAKKAINGLHPGSIINYLSYSNIDDTSYELIKGRIDSGEKTIIITDLNLGTTSKYHGNDIINLVPKISNHIIAFVWTAEENNSEYKQKARALTPRLTGSNFHQIPKGRGSSLNLSLQDLTLSSNDSPFSPSRKMFQSSKSSPILSHPSQSSSSEEGSISLRIDIPSALQAAPSRFDGSQFSKAPTRNSVTAGSNSPIRRESPLYNVIQIHIPLGWLNK